jgi:hypothetical protein
MGKALGDTGGDKCGQAVSQTHGAFWRAHQRFFNTIITSFKVPGPLVASMEKDIAASHACLVQLVSTQGAATDRALAGRRFMAVALSVQNHKMCINLLSSVAKKRIP